MKRWLLLALLAWIAASGCSGTRYPQESDRPFAVKDLAKSDLDVIAEGSYRELMAGLRTLMVKLYRRNPSAWRDSGKPDMHYSVERVFRARRVPDFVELGGRRGSAAVRLAFDQRYRGDRVLAFVAGLTAMAQRAYGERSEFFIFDQIDPQKLYNSARNIEIAAWLLATKHTARGQPMLLADSRPGEPRNLSFERLFGKLIATQDLLAKIVANRTKRTIRHVLQRVGGALFLPI